MGLDQALLARGDRIQIDHIVVADVSILLLEHQGLGELFIIAHVSLWLFAIVRPLLKDVAGATQTFCREVGRVVVPALMWQGAVVFAAVSIRVLLAFV